VNNDISYQEQHKQQLQSSERQLGTAAEPENVTRGKANIPVETAGEFPVRIVPRVEVVFGAVLNTVNEVVEAHKTFTPVIAYDAGTFEEGEDEISLYRPLTRKVNGVAIQPLTSLYEFLQGLELEQYLIVCEDAVLQQRTQGLIDTLHAQLQDAFGGVAFEQHGVDFSIARGDYFSTSVTQYTAEKSKTVNIIHLVIRVHIHAASLTNTSADPAEAMTTFDLGYRQVIKNFAAATKIQTQIAVAFDVSNFTVRPNLLSLFSALCAEPGAEADAVNKDDHIDANVIVSVALTNPNAKLRTAPKKKVGQVKPKQKGS
jgi:hypothetical protein